MKAAHLLTTCVFVLATSALVEAQPHHHHSTSRGYIVQPQVHNHVLVDPHGHVVVQQHANYQYVVPPASPTLGTYYTYQSKQYYTPPPQVVGNQTAYAPPAAVAFGSYSHVDDLSARIETLANEVCLDLHYNYHHNPGYQETYGEAYSLLQQAKALHAAEHNQDRNFIRAAVQGLDGLFHHVQEHAANFSPHVERPVGPYSLPEKLAQLESMIHHLMHDVGIAPHAAPGALPVGPGGVEQAPPPAGVFQTPPTLPGAPQYSGAPAVPVPVDGSGVFLNTAPPNTLP
jgi:hypothetical protein